MELQYDFVIPAWPTHLVSSGFMDVSERFWRVVVPRGKILGSATGVKNSFSASFPLSNLICYVLYDARTLHLAYDVGWNMLGGPTPQKQLPFQLKKMLMEGMEYIIVCLYVCLYEYTYTYGQIQYRMFRMVRHTYTCANCWDIFPYFHHHLGDFSTGGTGRYNSPPPRAKKKYT